MSAARCIWLDAFSINALPRIDEELGRAGALVMRSFQRVPQPAIAARFGEREQAVVLSGRTFDELERRLEIATVTLRVPIIAVAPAGVSAAQVARRAGLVDVVPSGLPAREAAARILLMSGVPVVTAPGTSRPSPAAPATSLRRIAAERPIVAVASSTGGLLVLSDVLRRLPPQAVGGVLVAQHMDAEFVPLFVAWLAEASGWPVDVIREPRAPSPGRVFIPDGGHDLHLDAQGRAVSSAASSRYVPNADRLLTSVGRAFGERAVAVVLSGMGEDGARGAAEVARSGGRVLAQSPATAAVGSMPQAAAKVPGACVLRPEELAFAISEES